MATAKKTAHGQQDLDSLIAAVNRAQGAGSLMPFDGTAIVDVPVVSTGSVSLNHALGVGGYPRGRVIEIYGPEAGGKTTMALHAIAEAQRAGGVAVFVDAEHALKRDYCLGVGVDADRMLVTQPDSGEKGLETVDMSVRSGAVDIIVVDSVAALVPQVEINGEMGDQHPGAQARLMGQGLRKITSGLTPEGPTIIFINQLREKIGVMFGNPETTPGGKALKFYASVRLDVRRVETLKNGDQSYGNRVRVRVVKNKLAPPARQAEFDLIFGRGVWRASELVDLGATWGVITKAGAHYSFGGSLLGQGRNNAAQALEQRPEVMDGIEAAISLAMESGVPAVPDSVPAGPGTQAAADNVLLAGQPDFGLRS
jgi:recombination protein RecA